MDSTHTCNHTKHSGLLKWYPCHRREDRSIHIRGKAMPLCARCTAILMGYALAPFAVIFSLTAPIWFCIVICIPMLIDGFTQLWKWRESNNVLRVFTGLLFGVGQSLFISTVVMYFIQLIG